MKLITFFHVGHPSLSQAQEIAGALLGAGTDILEFGIPFSDPVADGPVIQAASYKALLGGATPKKCMQEIAKVNAGNGKEKMILTYYNIVYKYGGAGDGSGVQKFVEDAAKAGVNYLLAADLPIEESAEFETACKKNGVKTVFMVAPNTTDERIAEIAKHATGFIYLMARFGVTGERSELSPVTIEAVKRMKKMCKLPVCVGFGISTPEHVKELKKAGADGAIVGSAIIRLLDEKDGIRKAADFAKELKVASG